MASAGLPSGECWRNRRKTLAIVFPPRAKARGSLSVRISVYSCIGAEAPTQGAWRKPQAASRFLPGAEAPTPSPPHPQASTPPKLAARRVPIRDSGFRATDYEYEYEHEYERLFVRWSRSSTRKPHGAGRKSILARSESSCPIPPRLQAPKPYPGRRLAERFALAGGFVTLCGGGRRTGCAGIPRPGPGRSFESPRPWGPGARGPESPGCGYQFGPGGARRRSALPGCGTDAG